MSFSQLFGGGNPHMQTTCLKMPQLLLLPVAKPVCPDLLFILGHTLEMVQKLVADLNRNVHHPFATNPTVQQNFGALE